MKQHKTAIIISIVFFCLAAAAAIGLSTSANRALNSAEPSAMITLAFPDTDPDASPAVTILTSKTDDADTYAFAAENGTDLICPVPKGTYMLTVVPPVNQDGSTYAIWSEDIDINTANTPVTVTCDSISRSKAGLAYYNQLHTLVDAAFAHTDSDETKDLLQQSKDMLSIAMH